MERIAVDFLSSCVSFTLFIAALLYAAISDAKTREIPNAAHLLLLIAGALNILARGLTAYDFISALLGLFLGSFPLLILALWRKTIGGGDVKLAASAGFVLGWLGSYLALMAALIAFVLFACLRRPKKEAPALPFAPFYAAAGIGAFVLPFILNHPFTLQII